MGSRKIWEKAKQKKKEILVDDPFPAHNHFLKACLSDFDIFGNFNVGVPKLFCLREATAPSVPVCVVGRAAEHAHGSLGLSHMGSCQCDSVQVVHMSTLSAVSRR